jgi:hypothetical protein
MSQGSEQDSSLPLFVPRILFADYTQNAFSTNNFTVITAFLY